MKNFLYYLHSFLFAALAPLYVYIAYPDQQIHASPNSVWRLVVAFLVFSLFLTFTVFVLLREHLAAGLISTCLILGMLYPRYPFLFIIAAILFSSLLLMVVRKSFELRHAYVACTAISSIIVVYIGIEYMSARRALDVFPVRSVAQPVEIRASIENIRKPDLYYIILDAYAGETILKELHGFDNSEFTDALRERGFFVPSEARSNYLRTIHSLSSSLNMQYLDTLSETMGNSPLWWPIKKAFTDNEVRKFLESQGYKTVVVASGWDFTAIENADVYRQPYPFFLTDFEEFFLSNTSLSLFQSLGRSWISFPSYDTHREIILYEFEQLKNIPELASPKFIFVHIIAPHPPFVFDSDGNPVNPTYPFTIADNRYLIAPPSEYQAGYLEQLAFVNTQVLDVVDAILEKSVEPPIIIIQGDHGPGIFIDSQTLTPPCFNERYSILNAYYLPGVDPTNIPQDITTVNTFRIIFNQYFSADLQLLPNHHFFSLPETIHQFEDVTDRIQNSCTFPP